MSFMTKNKIYVIDDEEINLEILQGILEEHYDVTCFSEPHSCLDEFGFSPADIVLLDVDMPVMDGLETCRHIIEMEPNCPVLFISSKVSDEDRIAGYEAGGFDYLSKPYNGEELLKKIELVVKGIEYRAELNEEKDNITTAFMDAITGSGEQGVLLHFASRAFEVKTYHELAQTVAGALEQFNLKASILIGGEQAIEFGSTSGGFCSPIECNTLELLRKTKRIYEFNGRYQFNEKNISLLIKNMPDDEEITGRFRDHILLLLRIASSCVDSLDAYFSNNLLVERLKNISDKLSNAESSVRRNIFSTLSLIDSEVTRIENEIQFLALSEEQENLLTLSLAKTLEVATQSSNETATECDNLTAIVNYITKSL